MAELSSDTGKKLRSQRPQLLARQSSAREPDQNQVIAGTGPVMRTIQDLLAQLAGQNLPVLLMGENGTGKRTIALEFHRSCGVRDAAITKLTCSEACADSLQSALSCEKNNGSGSAHNTGLLLEEIGDLSLSLQSKLARGLNDLLTSPAEKLRGMRLVATTTKELLNEVHTGRFREDLHYLISGITLRLPPLRHRREDIPALTDYFLEISADTLQRPKFDLTPAMQRFLLDYPWPGNIEELRDTLTMIAAIGDERLAMAAMRSRAQEVQRSAGLPKIISLKQAARVASRNAERELILKVLSRTMWNRKHAAQQLQISYKALLYKLKQTGLQNGASSLRGGEA